MSEMNVPECLPRARKRTRNPERNKAFIQKQKVQQGEEHRTKNGQLIARKTFAECASKIDVMRQKEIFDIFHKITNWTKKTLYLRSALHL